MKKISNKQMLFRRFAAFVYDSFVVFSFWILLTALALVLNQGNSLIPYQYYFLIYLWVGTGFLYIYQWYKMGQTIGMAAWRLRIVQQNGLPITVKQAFIRYGFGWISFLCAGLGWFWCDKIAKTKIIYTRLSK